MKIDLHCHTKKCKSGDSEKRNISVEEFIKKIENADVKIVAITNHNEFDIEQYKEILSNEIDFQVWPGIEFDIKDENGDIAHLIIISNPKNVEEFNLIINSITENKNAEDICIDINEIINKFKDKDVIFIAHSVGKNKKLTQNMIDKLNEKVIDKYRLFLEPSSYKTLSVMVENGFRAIMGSDVDDWDKYVEYELPELKLEVENFERFVLLAKKDNSTINTLLMKKEKKDININIKIKGKKIIEEILPIYNDVNVIFGLKGTGKSCIIDGFYEKYISDGISCAFYRAKDVDDTIKKMTNIGNDERYNTKFDLNVVDEFILYLENWTDKTPTGINNYIQYVKTKDNNKNKQKLQITKLKKENNNSKDEYVNYLDKRNKITNIINIYNQLDLNSILNTYEIENIKYSNKKIFEYYDENLMQDYIKYKAIDMSNKCIDKFKEKADTFSSSKSVPSSTGFFEFCSNRIHLKNFIDTILDRLNKLYDESVIKIGNLDDGKEVHLKKEYKAYQPNDNGYKYGKTNKVLNKIFEDFKKIRENYNNNINSLLNELIQDCKDGDVHGNDFIGIKKYFINENGDDYEPSDGEKIMLVLHEELFKDKDVYILDEPERSLGNNFINDVVVPRINELAKNKKTIIIATHNANIAVRTLPFMSILKEYVDGTYKIFIGNPFINKLINLHDKHEVLDWKDESIKILEGGKEAFYDREDVYESRENNTSDFKEKK